MVWERTIINGNSNWHPRPDMVGGGNLQGVMMMVGRVAQVPFNWNMQRWPTRVWLYPVRERKYHAISDNGIGSVCGLPLLDMSTVTYCGPDLDLCKRKGCKNVFDSWKNPKWFD